MTLGSPENEVGRWDNEVQRETTLAESFSIQATSVTNGQYIVYLKDTGKAPKKLSTLEEKDLNEPVVEVTWQESVDYAEWLSKKDPTTNYRLPTEAEREFATRAGTSTRYWSGDSAEDLDKVGWHIGNSNRRVHPVAELEPNPAGLYDVHGNVWEWCQEFYEGEAHHRVLRGGSALFDERSLRSAKRYSRNGDYRYEEVGFRLVGTPK